MPIPIVEMNPISYLTLELLLWSLTPFTCLVSQVDWTLSASFTLTFKSFLCSEQAMEFQRNLQVLFIYIYRSHGFPILAGHGVEPKIASSGGSWINSKETQWMVVI